MTENQLKEYISTKYSRETESCEWKAFSKLKNCVSGHAGEDLITYVSAIANQEGGQLVIGVKDKTLDIIGIQDKHDYTAENLPQRVLGNVTNLSSEGLDVTEFITSDTGKTVWILNIPKHSPRKPVFAHKKAWQRKGDSLISMTTEREQAILSEPVGVIYDWSAQICDGATISDLDQTAIKKARENYINKFPHLRDEVNEWGDIQFLNKAKVTVKGRITNAAILLLGKPEAEHFINPCEAKIRWILKDKEGSELDYEIFTCPILLNTEKVFSKIRNLKYRYLKSDSIFPDEVDKFDPYIIREALHNCIAHQDYEKGGRIDVVEKEDELVFANLGDFIPGSVENVIQEDAPATYYRNKLLADAMLSFNMVDTIGSGIRKMFMKQKSKFFPLPEYQITKEKVVVTITGKVLDLEYAKVLVKNPSLTLTEIILLDKVQKKKKLTDDEIIVLKSKGLIEGRKPNFHISATIAQTTGQEIDYINKSGIDDPHYRGLIIKYLENFGEASRKDFENLLIDKLPKILSPRQKLDKVRNLLQSLRVRGEITVNDKRIWSLSQSFSKIR